MLAWLAHALAVMVEQPVNAMATTVASTVMIQPAAATGRTAA